MGKVIWNFPFRRNFINYIIKILGIPLPPHNGTIDSMEFALRPEIASDSSEVVNLPMGEYGRHGLR